MKLFCIPYAGGNQYSLLELEKHIHPSIDIIFFELPGRGGRINEPLLLDLDLMALDIYSQLQNQLEEQDEYILYGHSLGGMIIFLVSRLLSENGHTMPIHIIPSGIEAPKFNKVRNVVFHKLNNQDFKQELFRLGGVPQEVMKNKELLDFYLPIFLADFTAAETYRYKESKPLDVPITCLCGLDDDVSESNLRAWKDETTHALQIHLFEGNHFFILNKFKEIGDIINTLSKVILPAN